MFDDDKIDEYIYNLFNKEINKEIQSNNMNYDERKKYQDEYKNNIRYQIKNIDKDLKKNSDYKNYYKGYLFKMVYEYYNKYNKMPPLWSWEKDDNIIYIFNYVNDKFKDKYGKYVIEINENNTLENTLKYFNLLYLRKILYSSNIFKMGYEKGFKQYCDNFKYNYIKNGKEYVVNLKDNTNRRLQCYSGLTKDELKQMVKQNSYSEIKSFLKYINPPFSIYKDDLPRYLE